MHGNAEDMKTFGIRAFAFRMDLAAGTMGCS